MQRTSLRSPLMLRLGSGHRAQMPFHAHVLQAMVVFSWLALTVWAIAVSLVWFFAIAPRLSDTASSLPGVQPSWFSPRKREQLEQYRRSCVRGGRSLLWWRFVLVFLVASPILFFCAIVLTVLSLLLR